MAKYWEYANNDCDKVLHCPLLYNKGRIVDHNRFAGSIDIWVEKSQERYFDEKVISLALHNWAGLTNFNTSMCNI